MCSQKICLVIWEIAASVMRCCCLSTAVKYFANTLTFRSVARFKWLRHSISEKRESTRSRNLDTKKRVTPTRSRNFCSIVGAFIIILRNYFLLKARRKNGERMMLIIVMIWQWRLWQTKTREQKLFSWGRVSRWKSRLIVRFGDRGWRKLDRKCTIKMLNVEGKCVR